MAKIKRALVSVSDKTGIVEFSRELAGYGVEILSTGGTAKLLREAGLAVMDVSDFTGFPEMLDGRVKTLHPRIHGGLLGRRDRPEHERQMAAQGIAPIDLVAITLYPFEATTAEPDVSLAEVVGVFGEAQLQSVSSPTPWGGAPREPASAVTAWSTSVAIGWATLSRMTSGSDTSGRSSVSN